MGTSDIAELVDSLIANLRHWSSQTGWAYPGAILRPLLVRAATALQSLSLELERVKSEYQMAHQRAADNLRLANAAEAESARLREVLSRDPSEAEISAAIAELERQHIAMDEFSDPINITQLVKVIVAVRARPDMEGGKL